MSTDREEIRWKFQLLLQNISNAIDALDNERKTIDERYSKDVNEQDKLRTKWFGGIGFLVVILIPLIITRYIEEWYSLIAVGAIIVGIIIWIWTNISLQNKFIVFREIDDTYHTVIKGHLLPLRGNITTLALVENFPKDKTELLIKYVSLYEISLTYNLTSYMEERLDVKQLDHELFRIHYKLSKESLNELKKSDLNLNCEQIESFIKEFEKNTKSKK